MPAAFSAESIEKTFEAVAAEVDRCVLRLVDMHRLETRVRRDVPEPVVDDRMLGFMVTVAENGGMGYAASSDLSAGGLRQAVGAARARARISAAQPLFDSGRLPLPVDRARVDLRPPGDMPGVVECLDLAREASGRLKRAAQAAGAAGSIVDWHAGIELRECHSLLLSTAGARIEQSFRLVNPGLSAVASDGAESQQRTHGDGHMARQGGLELIEGVGFLDECERTVEDALALLATPECPAGTMDVVLLPGQMILQLHESVGHPLELDRILGDERNYAGGSFVTPDMIGSYRYGASCLNVVFDPEYPGAVARFAYDDEGTPARRFDLIRDGILVGAIGGMSSSLRAGIPAAASARSSGWNRPPIDRMANINLLPGSDSLETMVGAVERGVLMDTNRSWSIDHQRNKFQFGCEIGRRIDNGELKELVKNPGYRGVSSTFWRSLERVGDAGTESLLGTMNCGKGEPNQLMQVGHAAPACLFRGVEVFGGG